MFKDSGYTFLYAIDENTEVLEHVYTGALLMVYYPDNLFEPINPIRVQFNCA